MTSLKEQLAARFKDKKYRHEFVAEFIDTGIAYQIRAMRKDRGWSQRELGEQLDGMKQVYVSKLEDSEYGRYNLTTLKRVAAAFDVALVVRYVAFSRLINWSTNLTDTDLAVPEFADDMGIYSSAAIPIDEMIARLSGTSGSRVTEITATRTATAEAVEPEITALKPIAGVLSNAS